jgi:sigma-B regulation protein RsbU (phosphoserine phosphatase)
MQDTRKVLVIDDNPEDRTVFRRFLTRGQDGRFTVLEAETVTEGLQLVRAEQPDCAVVDYSMTDETGLSFLREVLNAGLDTPVIMLTGTGSAVIAVEAMKTGAQDYLSKTDITADRLRRAVENAIAKRDLEHRLAEQQRRERLARDAADRSSARLTLALDAANQAFYEWEVQGRRASWSERLPDLFGLSVPDLASQPRALFRCVHPEDRAHVCATLRQALAERSPFRAEFRVLCVPGEPTDAGWTEKDFCWLAVSGRVFVGKDGRAELLSGVLWDITDRRRAEQEMTEIAHKQARIAETLQRAMLLTPPDGAFPGLDLTMRYEAAWEEAQIGGDFFDAFAVDDNQVALVVGDVTGKGLAAAAYTAEVKYALRTLLRDNRDVSVALERMNALLLDARRLDHRPYDALVAAAVVVVDTVTGRTVCGTAGAEPPLIFRAPDGASEEVEASGALLGALADVTFASVAVTLEPGDVLILTTDGITEARRPDRSAFFGYEGLVETASASLRRQPLDAAVPLDDLADAVTDAAKEYAGGYLNDDVCLLLARRFV